MPEEGIHEKNTICAVTLLSTISYTMDQAPLPTQSRSLLLQQTLEIRNELNKVLTIVSQADSTAISADLGLVTSYTVRDLLLEIARKKTSSLLYT